jgi:hypothetical protein
MSLWVKNEWRPYGCLVVWGCGHCRVTGSVYAVLSVIRLLGAMAARRSGLKGLSVFTPCSYDAFVVGNNAYPGSPLAKCVNDAKDMSDLLAGSGYNVTLLLNATKRDMRRKFDEFCESLSAGSMVVVYFAGHGLEREGRNFLMPIDGEARSTTGELT